MTSSIYAYASRPHYTAHIKPVAAALEQRGVDVNLLAPGRTPPFGAHVIVASNADVQALGGRRLIYVEHGAGQTYNGDPLTAGHPGYPGGGDQDRVELFLCPNQEVADLWAATYPTAQTAVVGCPMLDRWHPPGPPPTATRIAVTFHWPSALTVEAGTAWGAYARAVERLVPLALEHGWSLVGHSHPRWDRQQIGAFWDMAGIPQVSYQAVMDTATILVADNTSMLPEFASLGRPVLWLNSPDWRRDVHHGGRFWEWPEGQVQCDNPNRLTATLLDAMLDPPQVRQAREAMVARIYGACDGKASERAADAIEKHLADG